MSTQITLSDAEKEFDTSDVKAPTLKTGQIYKWRVIAAEGQRSKNGNNPMLALTLAPVTSNGKVLTQFQQRAWILIPTKELKAKGEAVFNRSRDRYFQVLQSFAAPEFNAFSKIEVTETGTLHYDEAGNVVKGPAKSKLVEAAKTKMLSVKQEVLNGDIIKPGQEAYAALLPPRGEDGKYPELGIFTQDVSPNSKFPVVDSARDMTY